MHRKNQHIHTLTGRLAVLFLALGLLLGASVAYAEEEPVDIDGDGIPDEILSEGEQEKDYYQQKVEEWSEKVTSTASWMDGFFDDERYRTTSNKSYLRLRLSPIYDYQGLRFDTYFDLRLLLPNTERWLLNFGGDPDKEDQFGSSSVEQSERDDAGKDSSNYYLGLNTFLKQTRTRNVGFGGGITYRKTGIVPYATFKWVELWEFDKWDLRGTQRFRYYTDTGPESKTMVDIEWPIVEKFFFRTSASALFKLNNPVNNYNVDYSLYQHLSNRRALKYMLRTSYASYPGRDIFNERNSFEVEYRQQWRDWFYTNVTPQVSATADRDWKLDPGIRIDFNVRIGHQDAYEFKSGYTAKQENLELKAREDRDKALQEGHERLQEWQQQQRERANEEQ